MNSIAQIWQTNRRTFAYNYKEKETLLEGPSNHALISLTVSISEGSNNKENVWSSSSFKTISQSANQWPSKEMKPMSKLLTCHTDTRYMHSCWKLEVLSRTAFNTSGALQDPVPTSLHFKKFFSRSSCSGHRVLEGTGSACKHVLCVLYVHCCELGKAYMCTICPLLWTKQSIPCSRNLEEPENTAQKL